MSLIVHHLNNSRSHRLLWMLEELELPSEIRFYERDKATMLAPPELKKVHPLGKSPVLEDGKLKLVETGAICEYLVDKTGKLGPANQGEGLLQYRQFMHYAEGSLMSNLLLMLAMSKVPLIGGIAVAATPDHLGKKALEAGMKLGTRCAECHRDHRGPGALVRTDSSLCVNCHGDIKSLYPQTKLATISDFGTDHPPFALSMIDASSGKVARAIPGTPGFAGEASGLKFPHAKHLDKKGIRTPTGVRVIECAECHKLDAVGARFEPIAMVGNCSECHRLEFEPAATKRQVPHGKPAEILTTLREFYSGVALGDAAIDVF